MQINPRQLEIIEAAGRIMGESGINGLTTKRLAESMGFSEAALYRHFKGKEEIIQIMLRYLGEILDERFAASVKDTGDPAGKLTAVLDDQLDFFQKNPHYLAAIFSEGLLEESLAVKQAIRQIMDTRKKHLMNIIRQGQEEKRFNAALPAEDLVHFIMGSFRLLMLQWRISGFSFDVKKEGKRLMRNLVGLICSPENKKQ